MPDTFESLVQQGQAQSYSFPDLVVPMGETPAAPAPDEDAFTKLVKSPQDFPGNAKAPVDGGDPFSALVNQAPRGFAVQTMGVQGPPDGSAPIVEKAKQAALDMIPDTAKEMGAAALEGVAKSPVGTGLSYLQKPMELMDAGLIKAADSTIAPGIKQALNPNDQWFPEVANHDLLNYALPSSQKVQDLTKEYGFNPILSDATTLAYAVGKTGLGIAADFADPLMLLGSGELTQAGKLALQSGATSAADAERYAMSLGVGNAKIGFTGAQASQAFNKIPGSARIAGAASKVKPYVKPAIGAGLGYSVAGPAGAVGGAGLGLVGAKLMSAFDYKTGVPEVDQAMSTHAALTRGRLQAIDQNFAGPILKLKFTPGENSVLAAAIEGTENAAGRDKIYKQVQKEAAARNVNLNATRTEQLADAALRIKQENELDLQRRVDMNLVRNDGRGNALGTIENYLVHKADPRVKALLSKNPELAAAVQEVLETQRANEIARDSNLSTYDAGKFKRTIEGTLEEANKVIKERAGVSNYFITDPVVATAMKRAETERLIQDTNLVNVVKKYGVEEKAAKGIAGLTDLKLPEGFTEANKLKYPAQIAEKVGYYITPRQTGQLAAYMDSYTRVFRNVALATPSYYIRNWGENIFKNWVQGVKIADWVDATAISKDFPKGTIQIGNKTVPLSEVRKLVKQWGIDSGGQFKEGINSWLETGKKLESDRAINRAAGKGLDVAKKAFSVVKEGGEMGENFSRRALFINRLKEGYSPAEAAKEVEKYLFDFNRTSPQMDVLRRYWDPFFQHAFKTLQIAPEMLAKNPGGINLAANNMMDAIQKSFQDPITAKEVGQLLPDYQKYQDPIIGPVLVGNSWLRRILENQTAIDNPGHSGGRTAILFKAPFMGDILNKFAFWNDNFGRQGGVVQPLLRSFIQIASGKDTFTGKNIDPSTQSADMAKRLNYALNSGIEGMVPAPNVVKFIKQQFGIGDPKYFTPNGVLLLHAALGKFVTVTNLDRDYLFKALALNAAHKEIMKNLFSQISKENAGRTADSSMAGMPYLKALHDEVFKTETSGYLYQKLLDNQKELQKTNMYNAGLRGQMSTADMIKNLRDLESNINTLSKQYEAAQAYRLEQLKNAPKSVIQQLAPGSNP